MHQLQQSPGVRFFQTPERWRAYAPITAHLKHEEWVRFHAAQIGYAATASITTTWKGAILHRQQERKRGAPIPASI